MTDNLHNELHAFRCTCPAAGLHIASKERQKFFSEFKRNLSAKHGAMPMFTQWSLKLFDPVQSCNGWKISVLNFIKQFAAFLRIKTDGAEPNRLSTAKRRTKKDAKSHSKHNFICVKTSYMFRLYIAIMRLNIDP